MPIPSHIQWIEPPGLRLLDQRRLPNESVFIDYYTPETVATSIRDMVVRGAPAIGLAAAYGMVLAVSRAQDANSGRLKKLMKEACNCLKAARPTAVNLAWAADRMLRLGLDLIAAGAEAESLAEALLEEAKQMHSEDILACKSIGRHGAELFPDGAGVLTHCNAGALATGGYGTALGVIRSCAESGKGLKVFCNETRPYLQGARLTAWELHQDGIPAVIVCDSMSGALMSGGEVNVVIVGADRIAKNGDTANKVGTYPLAVMAKRHGIPFFVAAPLSTFDESVPDGSSIPIERRPSAEVTSFHGVEIAPPGVEALNYAFDVTPADLITGIVTEHGVISPVDNGAIRAFLEKRIA